MPDVNQITPQNTTGSPVEPIKHGGAGAGAGGL